MNSRIQKACLALGTFGFFGLVASSATLLSWEGIAHAQIVPDSTLPMPSTVRIEDNVSIIEGGSSAGANLFHSFTDFSVLTGREAFFNNATSVQNIIGRVTGNSISNIDGLLRANGAANLFFINPNGIAFGPEARLDIGGSFLASSAESLIFADGATFSTSHGGNSTPLLTIATPVGLQLGNKPGAIRVTGTGNNIYAGSGGLTENTNPGLEVDPNQTLALVGGDVTLEGGILTAESGRIELGGAAKTTVSLVPAPTGFSLSYEEGAKFRPVRFSQAALADASGDAGEIRVRGESLHLIENSLLFAENQGTQTGNSIEVGVTGPIEVTGIDMTSGAFQLSGIIVEVVGEGDGGAIDLSAGSVLVADGAFVLNTSYGTGGSGDIHIAAADFVRISSSPIPNVQPLIETNTFGPGRSGDITITTRRAILENGGALASDTLGSGPGGKIIVNASQSLEVMGFLPNSSLRSTLTTSTFSSGDAGSIEINTQRVRVRDGGVISSSTLAAGSAGSVSIDASKLVEIADSPAASISSINSSGVLLDEAIREAFGLPDYPSGSAGSVTIRTANLRIDDGARLTSFHQGMGDAGAIEVVAEGIRLNNGGLILAGADAGRGGSISLDVSDRLRLQNLSQISATAASIGNGGSISIAAEEVSVRQGSTIAADSIDGNGGSIAIAAENFLASPGQITATGLGNGGIITIGAEEVSIRQGSTIAADSMDGNGGSIAIAAENFLISPGQITANASGLGNGGTITIGAEEASIRKDSHITADAIDGNGGIITIGAEEVSIRKDSSITANTIYGNGGSIAIAAEDLSVSPQSTIAANSEFGLDGTVAILESDDDFVEALLQFPEEVADLPTEVADIISLFGNGPCDRDSLATAADTSGDRFVEARGWQHDFNGNVVLTAEPTADRCSIASR